MMNKVFSNDSNAVFEDDQNIDEAFDQVFKQIHEEENKMPFGPLLKLWEKVAQLEKAIIDETNLSFRNEGLQSSIESEMKALKKAESSLDALKKRRSELVQQSKEKQGVILSSLDQNQELFRVPDDVENNKMMLQKILREYANELQEMRTRLKAKKEKLNLIDVL